MVLKLILLFGFNDKPTLVEVKATSGNVKSSKSILANYDRYKVDQCIKLGGYNIGSSNNIYTILLSVFVKKRFIN